LNRDAVRLLLRRRQGGRREGHEGPARRQGSRPRRDDERGPAGSARVHHLDGRLQSLQEKKGQLPKEIDQQIDASLDKLEKLMGKRLGDASDPLLVSVRSGAKFSMPGMMDTILNLGLNDQSVRGPEAEDGNGRFAADSYRRFIQMFGNVVLGIDKDRFEHELHAVKAKQKVKADVDLTEDALRDVIARFKAVVKAETGAEFPQQPREQLYGARDAVFKSWMNPRAVTYRKLNEIPHDLGTAVNVQSMVFGNMGDTSATGVGFTRNPSSGAKEFYGEFLQNAQGEDVVAGIRTPHPITDLEKVMPAAYKQLREITSRLEKHYKDVQDFEFTIQDNTLYMLQTRNGKRTGLAAVPPWLSTWSKRASSPSRRRWRASSRSRSTSCCTRCSIRRSAPRRPWPPKGLPASPGAATGAVVFTADDAVAWSQKGKRVLLVRMETVPDDIHGMSVAQGHPDRDRRHDLACGGRRPPDGQAVVVGCGALEINAKAKPEGRREARQGRRRISIDGTTGEVILKELPTSPSEVLQVVAGKLKPEKSALYQKFEKLLGWADEIRRLGVRANADIPRDAKIAFAFGARGIGLCRTEHMFFAEDRLALVVKMILSAARGQKGSTHAQAEGALARRRRARRRELKQGARPVRKEYGKSIDDYTSALKKLLPMQRADFAGPLQGDARPPGHDPHPRPAAARVPAQARGADGAGGDLRAKGEKKNQAAITLAANCCARSRSCTSSTPCSATAAAAWASPIPRSRACRRARSSRRRSRWRRGHAGQARGHDPARRPRRGAAPPEEDRAGGGRRGAGQDGSGVEYQSAP
jgi:phosphoenolpyruvate synthase/pyruvate phosphate dikinase